jgi:hypothetical protein
MSFNYRLRPGTPEEALNQQLSNATQIALTKQLFCSNAEGSKRMCLEYIDTKLHEIQVVTKIAEEHAKVLEIQAKSDTVIAAEKVKVELLQTISSGNLVKVQQQIALIEELLGL